MQEYEKKEERSGKIMGIICLSFAILLIIIIITAIILGYFISSKGNDGEIYDGLGRMLDEVPPALSFILPQWAGYIWFIIDLFVLLGMIIIIDKLFVRAKTYFTGIKNVDF